jgi:hypothetical protein
LQTALDGKASTGSLNNYLPLTGGSLSGALSVNGAVTATSFKFSGGDYIANAAGTFAQFLTSGNAALGVKVGAIVVSDTYADTASGNNMFVKGSITAGGIIYAQDFVLTGGTGSGISGLYLDGLEDVVISSASDGQVLKRVNGVWTNAAATSGSSVAVSDEGTQITSAASTINFAGNAVSAQTTGAGSVTVTVSHAVTSVFGRTGAVSATSGDYSLSQIGGVSLSSPSNGQILQFNGTNWVNAAAPATGVTSVGASGGTTGLSFTGSPITSTGTLTLSGTLAVGSGGTGLTSAPASNQILLGTGTAYSLVTLAAGSGISFSNVAGTFTISSTATGGVTSFGSRTGAITLGDNLQMSNQQLQLVNVITSSNIASQNVSYATSAGSAGSASTAGSATTAGTASQVANALSAGTGLSFTGGGTYNGGAAKTLNVSLATLSAGTGLSITGGSGYNGSTAVSVAIDNTVVTTTGSQTLTNKTAYDTNYKLAGTRVATYAPTTEASEEGAIWVVYTP